MRLRPYQSAMIAGIRRQWAGGKSNILGVLPTGGGKTEVATAIIGEDASPTTRVLVVVERKVLCSQWLERLARHGLDYVGVMQGANTIRLSAPIIVGTAQTIRSRGIPEDVATIVVDESHVWHQTHDSVLEALGNARVLGLTATPLRAGLGLRFDCVVVGARIRELIADGYLVRPRYYAPEAEQIERALDDVSIRAGDFAAGELSAAMRTKVILGDVVGTWQARGENRQTIAFCVDKAHAHELAAQFLEVGVAAEVVIDETPDDERARLFAAFDRGEIRILASVGVLSIGFDSPIASCAILARPTTSLSLFVQQGGRVLRPCAGKKDALILDHAGNTLRFGLLEDFDPPTDLSMVDARTDKRTRKDRAEVWKCKHCDAVNSMADDICVECGEPRRRHTSMIVVDGELRAVEHAAGTEPPGPTIADIRRFYLMLRWFGRNRGMSNPEGFAFHTTLRRFSIPLPRAKTCISWDWRYEEPIVVDEECSRWLRADFKRRQAVTRYQAKAHA